MTSTETCKILEEGTESDPSHGGISVYLVHQEMFCIIMHKGLFINNVSQKGGGVNQKLTFTNRGGGGSQGKANR